MNETRPMCPTNARWERFMAGELTSTEQTEFESHLERCPECAVHLREQSSGVADSLEKCLAVVLNDGDLLSFGKADQMAKTDVERPEFQAINNLITRIQGYGKWPEPMDVNLKRERAAEVLWMLEPGQLPNSLGSLAHYDLLEFLGAGSSGVVFAARDRMLHRDVAIKILRPSLGPLAQDRFLSEARSVASLVHENIVTIFEVGLDQGLAYLTMPLLPGETLEQRLQRMTFLPESESRQLAREVCTALDVAHQRQLIHRDVKPANIWLDSRSGQVKLLDFGLAVVEDVEATATGTGLLAGTPGYMSPEQTRGENLDDRSDLFSLGCVLYRCITGRLPFVGSNVLATLQAIQNQSPVAPHLVNSACSPEFSRMILALLEKDRSLRPRTSLEICQALDTPERTWSFLHGLDAASNLNTSAAALESSDNCSLKQTKDAWQSKPRPPITAGLRSIVFGGPLRWISMIVALGLFGFGGWWFLTDEIRIKTADGELVIETDDPNVQIEVLHEGQLIQVLDIRSQSRLKIAAGIYSIQPSRSMGGDVTFEISPGVVELKQGERQIVKISKTIESTIMKGGDLGPETRLDTSTPTYQGRTVEQWVKVLAVEHDPKTLIDGIGALSKLMGDNPDNQALGIELVRKILRQHGTSEEGPGMMGGPTLRATLDAFFNSLPTQYYIDFLQVEMLHGNMNSLMYASNLGNEQSFSQADFRQALVENRRSLLEAYFRAVNERYQRGELKELELVASIGRYKNYWHFEIQDRVFEGTPQRSLAPLPGMMWGNMTPSRSYAEIIEELSPNFSESHALFRNAYREARDPLPKVLLAPYFNFFYLPDQDVISDMLGIMNDEGLPVKARMLALAIVLNYTGADVEFAIPGLLDFGGALHKIEDFPSHYATVREYHGPSRFDKLSLQIGTVEKKIRYFMDGIGEDAESGQANSTVFGLNRLVAPVSPVSKLRLNIVEFFHRAQLSSKQLRLLVRGYLQSQFQEFSDEEIELARVGLYNGITYVKSQRVGEIYAQAIINQLVAETMAKFDSESE